MTEIFTITGQPCTVDCDEYHVMWASMKQRRERGSDPEELESDMCRIHETLAGAYVRARHLVEIGHALAQQLEIYRVRRSDDDIDICGVYGLTETGVEHMDMDG